MKRLELFLHIAIGLVWVLIFFCLWLPKKTEQKTDCIAVPSFSTLPEPIVYLKTMSQTPLWINGRQWEILVGFNDDFMDKHGYESFTDCKQRLVFLHSDLSAMDEKNDIIHEALHATACQPDNLSDNFYFNSKDQIKHEGFNKIADFISLFMHDNPELAKFLYQ
jgi:hypothetical protein